VGADPGRVSGIAKTFIVMASADSDCFVAPGVWPKTSRAQVKVNASKTSRIVVEKRFFIGGCYEARFSGLSAELLA
jgi:hypothetical protein